MRITKSVKEAIALYKLNFHILLWEATAQEMKNVIICFKFYDVNVEDLPPRYQKVNYHRIFMSRWNRTSVVNPKY